MIHNYLNYDHPLFRPPSEATSQIFQITLGCSHNSCVFCGMYKTKTFRVRPVSEILMEVQQLPVAYRMFVKRVFLADGDALIYPQAGLVEILDHLQFNFPNLTRVGTYASPNSLMAKTVAELKELQRRKLRILYFGLESGDQETLAAVNKGYVTDDMLKLCRKAQDADLKLSVTAILGLAGRERSREHAQATAEWINALSPEYFSLLTLFQRDNDNFLRSISPLTNGGVIEEALEIVRHLNPRKTILRSNHVSNVLHLAGSYPKDRNKIIAQAEHALALAERHPVWFHQVPEYVESDY